MLNNKNLKIGVIGHGKQAKKVIECLNFKNCIYFYNYRKNNKNIKDKLSKYKIFDYKIINEINSFLNYDIIFILCPNKEHFFYLSYFLKKKFKGYIFCEKPLCDNKNDFIKLKSSILSNYKKIYINFNYRKSPLFAKIRENINLNDFGNIILFSFNVSQGLAYKKDYLKDWRTKKNPLSIITNKSIHLIDISNFLFKNVQSLKFSLQNHSKKKDIYDTCTISIFNEKKLIGYLFSSYATPLNNEFQIISTNSILNYRDSVLSKISPRDTFNKENYFIRPKNKIIFKESTFNEMSLRNSLEYFSQKINHNNFFTKKEILQTIKTHELIFNSLG